MLDLVKKLAASIHLNFSSKRKGSPNNTTKAKSKNGKAAATAGDSSPIQIAETINNYTSESNNHQYYKEANELIRKAIKEALLNTEPGIGNSRCNFRTSALEALIASPLVKLPEELSNKIDSVIVMAHKCNGDVLTANCRPGIVKETCKVIADELKLFESKFKI